MRKTAIVMTLAAASAVTAVTAGGAQAETTTLRIQTHLAPESTYGRVMKRFVEDVETMSEGSLDIEMFYSASVVDSAETFDAAASGILDCDMTNGSYQTGKNPAFQFVSDTMGGYDTPLQYMAWLNHGGGHEVIDELYAPYGMTFVGAHLGGQESLNSTTPIAGPEDLTNWKFRSPPGMLSEIFAGLGAKPVVMDFTEIFTALETGIIDGADAGSLAVNVNLGIYDIAKHTTYPGFHSMAADQLACRTDKWEGLTDAQREIVSTAHKEMAFDLLMLTLVENGEALVELPEQGVTIYDWAPEDRATFREAALTAWDEWATKTPETQTIVQSHKDFIERIGLGD